MLFDDSPLSTGEEEGRSWRTYRLQLIDRNLNSYLQRSKLLYTMLFDARRPHLEDGGEGVENACPRLKATISVRKRSNEIGI